MYLMETVDSNAVVIQGYADGTAWISLVSMSSSSSRGMLGPLDSPIGWIKVGRNKHDLMLLDIRNKRTIGRFASDDKCEPVISPDGRRVHWVVASGDHWALRSVDCTTGRLTEHQIATSTGKTTEHHIKISTGETIKGMGKSGVAAALTDGRVRVAVYEPEPGEWDVTKMRRPDDVTKALTIDPESGVSSFVTIDNPISFSPSGRYVLTTTHYPSAKKLEFGHYQISLYTVEPFELVRELPVKYQCGDYSTGRFGFHWQADEQAFWMLVDEMAVCVGVDGTRSPPIYVNEAGKPGHSYSTPPCRAIPLDNRHAVLFFNPRYTREGETSLLGAIVDGSPSEDLKVPRLVHANETNRADYGLYRWTAEPKLAKLVRKTLSESVTVVLPLINKTPASLIAALDAMTKVACDPAFWHQREADGFSETPFVFEMAGWRSKKRILEADFFQALIDKKPAGVVPALQRLLSEYLSILPKINPSLDHPYSSGDDGITVLTYALRALVRLDGGSAVTTDLFRRYTETLDKEHATDTLGLLELG